MPRTSDPHNVTSLIDFALDSLPAMQHKDGAFCFERRVGNPAPLGRSPRYTLMVELGLLRAQTAGYTLPIDPDELNTIAWRELHTGNLTPGDIGLMLWTDARRDRRSGHKLAEHLTHALHTNGGLQARLGMELGWIITGLAHHQATNPSQTGARLLTQALDQLLTHNRAPTGLFRHFGNPGWRRRFPNFATQIYSVLALATVARHNLDDRALPAATTTANHLLHHQLPDGGWPWLYDAERGNVVEQYEIYSVHQDAMAPMALLELAELTQDPRYTNATATPRLDPRQQRTQPQHDRPPKRHRPPLNPTQTPPQQTLQRNQNPRITHPPHTQTNHRTPHPNQPNRPPIPLRLGPRSLDRTRKHPQPLNSQANHMTPPTYAIVTPARNERDNLRRLAESVFAQRHAPTSWIIVDDGSDDGMREAADDLAQQNDWIHVVETGEDAANIALGRRRGRDLLAFRRGLSSLPAPVDVFVKVDADTSFDPDYFERLLERFAREPELGIAGGTCYEVIDGEWQRVKVSGSHPRGASRAYRWALLDDVFALEPEMGWDGVDEVMAELRGYRTAGFRTLDSATTARSGSGTGDCGPDRPSGDRPGTWATGPATSSSEPSIEVARTSRPWRWSGDTHAQRPAALRSARTYRYPSGARRAAATCRHAPRRLGLADRLPRKPLTTKRRHRGQSASASARAV